MNLYSRYVRSILGTGEPTSPRGLPAKFKLNQTFTTIPGITYRREKDNPLIGFMEGLQFIAGVGDIDQIARVAPKANLSLFTGQSIYGPRAGSQPAEVIEELLADRNSRRAVIILGKPNEALADRPCTTSLQYQIVDNKLETVVSMRSSDAVYGLPYDLTQFGMMSQMIAQCVNASLGKLIVNIGNAHIYDSTAHLAVGYRPWAFRLPEVSDYKHWVAWAESRIPYLCMQMAEEELDFHEEISEGMWI